MDSDRGDRGSGSLDTLDGGDRGSGILSRAAKSSGRTSDTQQRKTSIRLLKRFSLATRSRPGRTHDRVSTDVQRANISQTKLPPAQAWPGCSPGHLQDEQASSGLRQTHHEQAVSGLSGSVQNRRGALFQLRRLRHSGMRASVAEEAFIDQLDNLRAWQVDAQRHIENAERHIEQLQQRLSVVDPAFEAGGLSSSQKAGGSFFHRSRRLIHILTPGRLIQPTVVRARRADCIAAHLRLPFSKKKLLSQRTVLRLLWLVRHPIFEANFLIVTALVVASVAVAQGADPYGRALSKVFIPVVGGLGLLWILPVATVAFLTLQHDVLKRSFFNFDFLFNFFNAARWLVSFCLVYQGSVFSKVFACMVIAGANVIFQGVVEALQIRRWLLIFFECVMLGAPAKGPTRLACLLLDLPRTRSATTCFAVLFLSRTQMPQCNSCSLPWPWSSSSVHAVPSVIHPPRSRMDYVHRQHVLARKHEALRRHQR